LKEADRLDVGHPANVLLQWHIVIAISAPVSSVYFSVFTLLVFRCWYLGFGVLTLLDQCIHKKAVNHEEQKQKYGPGKIWFLTCLWSGNSEEC